MIEKARVNRVEPLHHELSTFVDCVREDRPFPITLEEGAANLEVCERIADCFPVHEIHRSAVQYSGSVRGY